MSSICKRLAQRGIAAFNATYRLGPLNPYPAAVDDVKAAIQYLRESSEVLGIDASRIFVWGYSAGGHLALLVGLDPESKIRGIVAGAAPANFSPYRNSFLIKSFLGKTFEEDPALWKSASPVNRVSAQSPPTFLYHGERDWIVGIEQMEAMKSALEKGGVSVRTKRISGMGHISVYLWSSNSITEAIEFILALS
jgi:acetyl esterase/lipase